MKFQLLPDQHMLEVDIEISDIISGINEMPLDKRWAIIAQIFRECKFDEVETMGQGQKFAILQFLEKNYKLYKYGKLEK